MKYIAHATIKNLVPQFKTETGEKLWRHYHRKLEGKRVKYTIEEVKSKRSLNQNNLFHLFVNIMAEDQGVSEEQMKRIIKGKFLPYEVVTVFGVNSIKYTDTASLSVGEMANLINEVVLLAGEFGI